MTDIAFALLIFAVVALCALFCKLLDDWDTHTRTVRNRGRR